MGGLPRIPAWVRVGACFRWRDSPDYWEIVRVAREEQGTVIECRTPDSAGHASMLLTRAQLDVLRRETVRG